MRLRRVIGGLVFVVLLAGGAVTANAVTDEKDGVVASWPAPNGANGYYTSPFDIEFSSTSPGETCSPASKNFNGPTQTLTVSSTCGPSDPADPTQPHTGTFEIPLLYDADPPNFNPSDIVREADIPRATREPGGASVNQPTASGATVSCPTWPQDDFFPIGPRTTETCTATDEAGNQTTAQVGITVQDTRPPAFTAPSPAPLEGNVLGGYQATGPGGAYVIPTATDDVDGGVPVSCLPGPDAKFNVGSTPVTCTASDTRGNSRQDPFNVVVTDKTPPNFLVQPQDVTVQAENVNTGTPAANPCIQRFLNAPTANDVIDGSRLVTNNNSRTRFPMGNTTVTFTTTDTRNNATTAAAVVTIKRGPQGPCTIDTRRPGNPRGVQVIEGSNVVILRWRNPLATDFSHVDVYRQQATRSNLGVRVCRTRRHRCVDRGVRNGILYRYTLFAFDEAGNNSPGVSRFAKPHRILLLRPIDAARISRPPVFDWVSIRGADYYNLQLYRFHRGRQVKVLSRWPKRSQYDLAWRWRQDRRVRRFVPGHYYWYVWAGFGPLREGNYGKVMGPSDFWVVRRR